jgi:hypothetical protein
MLRSVTVGAAAIALAMVAAACGSPRAGTGKGDVEALSDPEAEPPVESDPVSNGEAEARAADAKRAQQEAEAAARRAQQAAEANAERGRSIQGKWTDSTGRWRYVFVDDGAASGNYTGHGRMGSRLYIGQVGAGAGFVLDPCYYQIDGDTIRLTGTRSNDYNVPRVLSVRTITSGFTRSYDTAAAMYEAWN